MSESYSKFRRRSAGLPWSRLYCCVPDGRWPGPGLPAGTPNGITAIEFSAASPALDAAAAASCPATDARGITRPKGNGCDIGAYKFDRYQVLLPLLLKN
ncbi:MAG: hypothetical protein JW862_15600 [Anaerolineales bacterium]|nr:hypothetical protein [Anaerolineales bacterium]